MRKSWLLKEVFDPAKLSLIAISEFFHTAFFIHEIQDPGSSINSLTLNNLLLHPNRMQIHRNPDRMQSGHFSHPSILSIRSLPNLSRQFGSFHDTAVHVSQFKGSSHHSIYGFLHETSLDQSIAVSNHRKVVNEEYRQIRFRGRNSNNLFPRVTCLLCDMHASQHPRRHFARSVNTAVSGNHT